MKNFEKATGLTPFSDFESKLGEKVVLTEKGNRLERLRRMRGYSAEKIASVICTDNTYLLDEIEIKEILWMWDRDRKELKELKS